MFRTGDVVGEQHHFVAVEFLTVFLRQSPSLNLWHKSDDEVSSADKRIDDVNSYIRQRASELGFEDMLNAFHHEIHNWLWRVDDTVRIGNIHREALKELLVDGIEKRLFL